MGVGKSGGSRGASNLTGDIPRGHKEAPWLGPRETLEVRGLVLMV